MAEEDRGVLESRSVTWAGARACCETRGLFWVLWAAVGGAVASHCRHLIYGFKSFLSKIALRWAMVLVGASAESPAWGQTGEESQDFWPCSEPPLDRFGEQAMDPPLEEANTDSGRELP